MTNSFVQDRLLAEEKIKQAILDKESEIEDKMEKIKNALDQYKDASIRIQFWEDYLEKNLVNPMNGPKETPQTIGDNNQKTEN